MSYPHNPRRVWAALSENPARTHRQLARAADVPLSEIAVSLIALSRLGYVTLDSSKPSAYRVIVPLLAAPAHPGITATLE